MGNAHHGVALWALVVLMLVGVLASVAGARADLTPNYSLVGYVEQPNSIPVPQGVTVDLISSATHQVYATTTSTSSGLFSFTNTAGGNTGGALAPGWWGLWVPPQAHLKLTGCNPCAILPGTQNPQYYWENSTTLTNGASNPVYLTNVQRLPYDSTLVGNVTWNGTGKPVSGASVELLAPTYNGFVLANNTTTTNGYYTLNVPSGTWVLATSASGSPDQFNYTTVTVSASTKTVNPVVSAYQTYGWINLASNPSAHVPNGGNVTLFDPSNGYIYTAPTSPGGFYDVGTYPAGFTSHGAQTFDVILSPVGYTTTWYPLTVSYGNPTGGVNPHYSYVSPIAPPATYLTTLNFSRGFGIVTASTWATLGSNAVFSGLPNASVGDLWAQLALDFQHNLSFTANHIPWVNTWVNSTGPFFPVGAANTMVGSVGFNQTTNGTLVPSTNCTGVCDLTSSAWLKYNWSQTYLSNGKVAANQKNYTLSFNFRHPTNGESINYTVVLPSGYVLSAGTPPPAQSQLVAAGPGGTWTSFTLVSKPSANAYGTATLSAVKYSGVSAIVNVTGQNFAFSQKNVLNQTRANYTVIVGAGENVTFSALNSSFPAGTNGTSYQWNFGEGPLQTKTQPTTWHTYAAGGKYLGSLKVTSSGGLTSSTSFTVWVGANAPNAVIISNATAAETHTTTGGATYLLINQSTTLHFNATGSTSNLGAGAPAGVISVAFWNFTAGKNPWTANYSAGTGANPMKNDTLTFFGAGAYLTSGMVNGTPVPFFGWQYNASLTVWDGGGLKATATLVVLVKDTEKPTAVANVLDARGRTVTSSGVVEGANHTAFVQLSANNTIDPHNGSVVWYNWTVVNKGNSSIKLAWNQSAAAPSYKMPPKIGIWLAPQAKPYTVNLTATDRAGNHASNHVNLTVAINTSQRPILSVTNLTAPSSMTEGTSYTIWTNVTNTVGKNSTALNLQVAFYLLPPSGSGSPINIGGSPGSVQFYNYSGGVVNSSAWAGPVNLKWNQTVRAQISFTPGRQGTFNLWANATATNEFASDYVAGGNQAHVQVSLNPSTLQQIEIPLAVGVVAIILIVVAVMIWRRGGFTRRSGKSPSGKPSSTPGRKESKDEDEDEE